MSTAATSTQGTGTFPRGVHPAERKALAADKPIEVLPAPKQVAVPVLQHIGAPNAATVKPRTEVKLGDVVGETDAFVSAPVHATLTGKTAKAGVCTLPNGRHIATVPIKAEGEQLEGQALFDEIFKGDWPKTDEQVQKFDAAEIPKRVRTAGIVGMGGAAFPTHVKLTKNEKTPIDTIVVNGCECEPFLTADYRVMLEASDAVVSGALLAAHAVGAGRVVIGIEDNKPAAIEAMRKACEGTRAEVRVVKTKYPQGGERQLIYALLGRVVPTAPGLPLHVGVVVVNVGTATAIARAVVKQKPFTHRVMTATGAGIAEPKNLLVPIGATYQDVIDFCGGLTADAARVVAGGPMMGFTLGTFEAPITKGTSGLTVLTKADVARAPRTDCVRCGRCVDVCPLNLVPTKLYEAAKYQDWDQAKAYHLMACVECGCCASSCPASIPLVQFIRMGKAMMPRE